MFGKLEIAFGHDIVAGGLRIAAKLHVFLGYSLRRAPHLHIRSVALIDPVDRVAATAAAATVSAPTAAWAAVVAATAALIVVMLPLACAMSVIKVQIITSAKKCRPILLRFCVTIPKIGP